MWTSETMGGQHGLVGRLPLGMGFEPSRGNACSPYSKLWLPCRARQARLGAEMPKHAPLLLLFVAGCCCRDFLRRKYAGLMEVEVKSASGLPAADVSCSVPLLNKFMPSRRQPRCQASAGL